jgi:hypothetical protein
MLSCDGTTIGVANGHASVMFDRNPTRWGLNSRNESHVVVVLNLHRAGALLKFPHEECPPVMVMYVSVVSVSDAVSI